MDISLTAGNMNKKASLTVTAHLGISHFNFQNPPQDTYNVIYSDLHGELASRGVFILKTADLQFFLYCKCDSLDVQRRALERFLNADKDSALAYGR